jgi:hypothetical protein
MNELVLRGLDGSNPLAFLAALGTLRLASLRWPRCQPLLAWRQAGTWQPVLSQVPVSEDALSPALLEAPGVPVDSFSALGKDLTVDGATYLEFLQSAINETTANDRRASDFAGAFASEVAVDEKKDRIQYTDFCFIAGSGHQHFLGTIAALAKGVTQEHLDGALFGSMRSDQKGNSFRWNPADASEYALQWDDPSRLGAWTNWGANRLAFEALPLLPVHPSESGRLLTTGFRREYRRHEFSWPMWIPPLSIDEVRSLVAWTEIHEANPEPQQLTARGVARVFRSSRVRIGQGANFKVSFRPARAL